MMASPAQSAPDGCRPAVAIVLLSAGMAWAQVMEQPVQPVQPVAPVEEIHLQRSEEPPVSPVGAEGERGGPGRGSRGDSGPIGGVGLRLNVGLGHDDNVFRTRRDTRSDFFWSLGPSIDLTGRLRKHALRLAYEGDYASYFDLRTEDFYDHRIIGEAELDPSRKVNMNLLGQVWWGHDDRGGLGSRIAGSRELDRWREHRLEGELVLGREITRAQIIPSVQYSALRYLNNDQSIRDFDRYDYHVRARWRFTPTLWGVVETGLSTIDHVDPANALDRDEIGLLAGIGWEATAKTSGEIKVGVLTRDFHAPGRGAAQSFNWDARVDWAPKPYSKVTAYTRRDSQESGAGGLGTFLADTYGIRWRHGFTERLDFETGAEFVRARFEDGREDDLLDLDLGLVYELTRRLDVAGTYRFRTRRSSLGELDYDDHVIMLELRATLEHRIGR